MPRYLPHFDDVFVAQIHESDSIGFRQVTEEFGFFLSYSVDASEKLEMFSTDIGDESSIGIEDLTQSS